MASLEAQNSPSTTDEAAAYELSIGDVMSADFVSVSPELTAGEAIDRFMRSPPAVEPRSIYDLYVVDDFGRLVGVVSLRELLEAPEHHAVTACMTAEPVVLDASAHAKQAALEIAPFHLAAIPVIDEQGALVGVVRAGTLLDVVEQESSEDMLRMHGMDLPPLTGATLTAVDSQRSTMLLDASIANIIRIRLPWLVVALGGGFLAGGVIGVFEAALEAVVILAFFLPLVMDMGGNIGSQSSTIFIRGVVLGHIDRRNVVRRIVKEVIVGAVIGLLVGAIAGVLALLWLDRLDIGIVVFGSMVATATLAALIGFLIPWLVYRLGQDPAAASHPIVTTIKDVSGLLIYFGLATLVIAELAG